MGSIDIKDKDRQIGYKAKALTIAGSDSGGGAGIQADLKTFQAFDVFGMSVITSVTAQNTQGIRSIQDVDPNVVGDQIDMIVEDIGMDAIKIGMLSNTSIIRVVIEKIKKYGFEKIVVDPVMISKSGVLLLKKEAEDFLIKNLLPLALLITPNLYEAEKISNFEIYNIETAKKAAEIIYKKGIKNVLIKGGHLPGNKAIDIFYNGVSYEYFKAEKLNTKNTHGTGCTYSAAITASIAKGLDLYNSIYIAKDYITRAIKNSPTNIGKGAGPLYHNIKPIERIRI